MASDKKRKISFSDRIKSFYVNNEHSLKGLSFTHEQHTECMKNSDRFVHGCTMPRSPCRERRTSLSNCDRSELNCIYAIKTNNNNVLHQQVSETRNGDHNEQATEMTKTPKEEVATEEELASSTQNDYPGITSNEAALKDSTSVPSITSNEAALKDSTSVPGITSNEVVLKDSTTPVKAGLSRSSSQ